LLEIERTAPGQENDKKFEPVHQAILLRAGVSRQDRADAAEALAALRGTSVVRELLRAIGEIDSRAPAAAGISRQLSNALLGRSAAELSAHAAEFRKAATQGKPTERAAALAALVTVGEAPAAWKIGSRSPQSRQDFLAAVPLVRAARLRAELRDEVLDCLAASQPIDVRRAAVAALAHVPAQERENFELVAPLVANGRLRAAAVSTLASIPKRQRPAEAAAQVVKTLVGYAKKTPARRRTTPAFLNAMHLADELLAALPVEQARGYRAQLRELVVRVVRIKTVHEEMRYDTPYFAVEAGRPVQLVLQNEDLMPHNLVITRPGKLREVAALAAGLPPTIDRQGRQYVPKSKDVLWSTRMTAPHTQDVLTFTAPTEPGEYPYVCTFPNHWMRMNGVMVVVEDLEAWRANPTRPADPLGGTREFVKKWRVEDFNSDVAALLRGRTPSIGERIFKEATCIQCHRVGAEGQPVGPDLAGVFERHKGNARSVLREILDPSHKIDPKYALYNVLTLEGQVYSGVITAQDRGSITVVTNPADPKPQRIDRDDIDEMTKASTSMMPAGLMDRYTKDEILELLAYIQSIQKPAEK